MRRWVLLLILLAPLLMAPKPENPSKPPTIPVPPHVELPPQAPTEPGNPTTNTQTTTPRVKARNSPWGDIEFYIEFRFNF